MSDLTPTINLQLTVEEADLLFDIIVDAGMYHHSALEQYTRLSDYELREGFFDKERMYHSEACDLCTELVWRLSSALGKKAKEDSE